MTSYWAPGRSWGASTEALSHDHTRGNAHTWVQKACRNFFTIVLGDPPLSGLRGVERGGGARGRWQCCLPQQYTNSKWDTDMSLGEGSNGVICYREWKCEEIFRSPWLLADWRMCVGVCVSLHTCLEIWTKWSLNHQLQNACLFFLSFTTASHLFLSPTHFSSSMNWKNMFQQNDCYLISNSFLLFDRQALAQLLTVFYHFYILYVIHLRIV